jgi:hypothetical protein
MNKFSDLSDIKEPELSEEERLEKEARIEKYDMTMRNMIDDAHEKAGKLKDRSTNVEISPELIERGNKTLELMESLVERGVDPEIEELFKTIVSTFNAYHDEFSEQLDLHNLRNACDSGHQQWRNKAGGKVTKEKYSYIHTVALDVVN